MIGLFSICACANQGAPPGGPVDRTGPQVVETFPDTFAVLAAFDEALRIVFDERISERGAGGTLDEAVTISPESGEIRVRHSSRALLVTMAGGFLPDQVYRVTVQPIVQDLFRNEMADAFEFIFSTGAEMTPTVLAGSIVDRLTEEPIERARVKARVERPQGVEGPDDQMVPTHVAISDSSGVFAFRYVPPGRYEITAFMDQNRNGEPDDIEPIATGREELNPGDTVFLDFSLLAPDTTPAIVARVEVVDSLTLAVEFDDFLDSASELAGVSASLGPDSLNPAEVATIIHERDYLSRMDAIQDSLHVADSIRFEEDQQQIELLRSAGDSVAVAEIESELTRPRPAAQSDARTLRSRDLPKQVLYLLLADTLATDQAYELSVAGVTNINGVPGGGGTAEVLREGSPLE
jgi:hypothetical protein